MVNKYVPLQTEETVIVEQSQKLKSTTDMLYGTDSSKGQGGSSSVTETVETITTTSSAAGGGGSAGAGGFSETSSAQEVDNTPTTHLHMLRYYQCATVMFCERSFLGHV